MASGLLLAAALMAQGPMGEVTVVGSTGHGGIDRLDVAYEELSQHRNQEAAALIEQNKALESDDPAAMINLGAAYARMGREAEARDCFMRAMASREHYDVELASGEWMSSRMAARKANEMLQRRQTLALAPRK